MYYKQILEIIRKLKEQTRRAYKPGETARDALGRLVINAQGERVSDAPIHTVYTSGGRIKWQVERDYAISPGRGNPGIWVNTFTGEWVASKTAPTLGVGWQRLRHTFLEIRFEPVQDISEEDAEAEGCRATSVGEFQEVTAITARDEYRFLWSCINTRAPHRWEDNPSVWAISFRTNSDE